MGSRARNSAPKPRTQTRTRPRASQRASPVHTTTRHPERSEGSAVYDRNARSLAEKTHKTTLSSGHGFNRVNNLGAQRLPLGGLPAEPSPNSTIQLLLLIEND